MCIADICSTYKKKGSKDDWKNAKGIFFITRFKKVMENLLFNDFYRDIDSRMSESNIGSTKKRNIKDNLIIMHGLINALWMAVKRA